MAKKSVNLKITSCDQCPHHGLERDPSSGDSFDWQDESLVCYMAGNHKDARDRSELGGYGWKAPAMVICGFSRSAISEYKRLDGEIPDWCPLRKKGK